MISLVGRFGFVQRRRDRRHRIASRARKRLSTPPPPRFPQRRPDGTFRRSPVAVPFLFFMFVCLFVCLFNRNPSVDGFATRRTNDDGPPENDRERPCFFKTLATEGAIRGHPADDLDSGDFPSTKVKGSNTMPSCASHRTAEVSWIIKADVDIESSAEPPPLSPSEKRRIRTFCPKKKAKRNALCVTFHATPNGDWGGIVNEPKLRVLA